MFRRCVDQKHRAHQAQASKQVARPVQAVAHGACSGRAGRAEGGHASHGRDWLAQLQGVGHHAPPGNQEWSHCVRQSHPRCMGG